jgi:8-oxo-dGTP pyrophosphatase MutT (NUDIX family)
MTINKHSSRLFQFLSSWDPLDATSTAPPIQVVTCFLQKEDKFLVLQRARKDLQHRLWGIPGGKLDAGEDPLVGLCREIEEEISVRLSPKSFQLLATTRSQTPSDGEYGLYLFYALAPTDMIVKINYEEHYAFRWVTLDQFRELDLLTAQGEAYFLVESKLLEISKSQNKRK